MPLTRKEFDLLTTLLYNPGRAASQRAVAALTGLSLGTVNQQLLSAVRKGWAAFADGEYRVTETGLEALAPYKVRRAVILAAGFGSRLMPVTLNTPKAMIRIHGRPLIETTLDALTAAGITDITIVRGYLGEQFDALLKKYPTIRFVENPDYREMNNISSAMKVKDLFGNAYVLDSDLYLQNPALIRPYEYCASYLGVHMDKTDDWRLIVKNGRVTGMKVGGTDCYHMYDITYWTEEDGEKMARLLPELFHSPGGKQCYWDDVPLTHYNDQFYIEPRPCKEGDILEIDTLSELVALAPAYRIAEG